jgi:hypothetical protein
MTIALKKSKIERSWSATIGYIVAGIVIIAIGVAIFMFGDPGLMLGTFAVVVIIFGLICFGMATGGAAVAPCPNCGKSITGLSTGSNEGRLCAGCHEYFEGTGGELWATDQSKIATTPIFSSPLPETFNFPPGCCVCGQPETRRVKISITTQGAGDVALIPVGVRSTTRTSVEVPHCAQHDDGAALAGTKDHPKIRFRSYPYLRAFCDLNKTTPA